MKSSLLFAAIVAVSITSCQSTDETAIREIEFQSAKTQRQLSLTEISLIHKEIFKSPEKSPITDVDFSTVQ